MVKKNNSSNSLVFGRRQKQPGYPVGLGKLWRNFISTFTLYEQVSYKNILNLNNSFYYNSKAYFTKQIAWHKAESGHNHLNSLRSSLILQISSNLCFITSAPAGAFSAPPTISEPQKVTHSQRSVMIRRFHKRNCSSDFRWGRKRKMKHLESSLYHMKDFSTN